MVRADLPDVRYFLRMGEASVLSSLVWSEFSSALMVRGQCDAGEKRGYDCWPSSMVNPITSTRPYRQVRWHFPRKHRVWRRGNVMLSQKIYILVVRPLLNFPKHTWFFCMTSTAWFRRSSLSAQLWRDPPSSLTGIICCISPEVLTPFPWIDWEYFFHSMESFESLSILNTELPLGCVGGFWTTDWGVFVLAWETGFALFFNLLTEGFFFWDALCTTAILATTGLELSSEEVMRGRLRLPLTSFHFWDLAWPFTCVGLCAFMILWSTTTLVGADQNKKGAGCK